MASVCAECVAITLSAAEMLGSGYPESAITIRLKLSEPTHKLPFLLCGTRTRSFGIST